MPIGLIGSLLICTIFYLLVASGAIGSIGAQPVMDAAGHGIESRRSGDAARLHGSGQTLDVGLQR